MLETGFRLAYNPKSSISFITRGTVHEEISVCTENDGSLDGNMICGNLPDCGDFRRESQKGFKKEKPDNTFRIIALGDSFTNGCGVGNLEQTYPYQLERILNENSKNLTYEVYNLGIGGADTYQELLVLKKFGLQYNPDLLILQYHPNDVDLPSNLVDIKNVTFLLPYSKDFVFVDQELVPIILPLPTNINEFILGNSHFLRFVSKRIDIIHQLVIKDNSEKEKWKKLNDDSLENIIKITKKENIPIIVIFVSGAAEQTCPHFLPIKLNVKEIALQNSVHFIDLCDYTEGYDSLEVKSKNDCDTCDHYNEKGYGIMAGAIFEKIQDLGFV